VGNSVKVVKQEHVTRNQSQEEKSQNMSKKLKFGTVSADSYERAHKPNDPGYTIYDGLFYDQKTKKATWRIVGVTFSDRTITGFSPR
jgi:hypothetical protein